MLSLLNYKHLTLANDFLYALIDIFVSFLGEVLSYEAGSNFGESFGNKWFR